MKIAIFSYPQLNPEFLPQRLAQCLRSRGEDCDISVFCDADKLVNTVRAKQAELLVMSLHDQPEPVFAAARRVREVSLDCEMIFVADTAQYAAEVMEFRAAAYLLRHVVPQSMAATLERVQKQRPVQKRRYVVHTRSSDHLVDHDRILYFHSDGHYAYVYIEGEDEPLPHLRRLDDIQGQLEGCGFVRCHQSYLVNRAAVEQVTGRKIVLKDGTQLPVSRRYSETMAELDAEPGAAV